MQNSYSEDKPSGTDNPTVTDLSYLAHGFPSFGASMNATNMVTDPAQFGAPGSPSEATADASAHNTPDLEMPPADENTSHEH